MVQCFVLQRNYTSTTEPEQLILRDRPHGNCYWVVPGKLMAGEYPGSFAESETRIRLRAILEAGITCFVDLTEPDELEPYDSILQEESESRGITCTHLRHAIPDMDTPGSPIEMTRILDAIDDAIAAGQVVYVHCWGGVGRTGTVVGCYLVRHGMTGQEAVECIDEKWKTVTKSSYHPHSPETAAQEMMIRDWNRADRSRSTPPC